MWFFNLFWIKFKGRYKLKNKSKLQKRNKNINNENKNHPFESHNKSENLYKTIIEDDDFNKILNDSNLENFYINSIKKIMIYLMKLKIWK